MADPLYVAYHDEEWGVPTRDERTLFELLNLEGAQAGLSWRTVLSKRDAYRRAFDDFDIETCAKITDKRIERLLRAIDRRREGSAARDVDYVVDVSEINERWRELAAVDVWAQLIMKEPADRVERC